MLPLIGIPCSARARTHSGYQRYAVGQAYCRALSLVGAAPVLIPLLEQDDILDSILCRLQGLLLSGGDDVDPKHYGRERVQGPGRIEDPRDRIELFLTRRALALDLPILAICRGLQLLNVALGGTLVQDIPLQRPSAIRHELRGGYPRDYPAHRVDVLPDSLLGSIVGEGTLDVNSLHHQCIDDLAPKLLPVALAPDGVVEAAEATGSFVLGVQWHPEELVHKDLRHRRIFEAFVAQARKSPRTT